MSLEVLDEEKIKRLKTLLAEADARGINVRHEIREKVSKAQKKIAKWPLDSNGYFKREDGRQYIPTEPQDGFIKSAARFCAFKGGRGSGKSAAGAQKALRKIMQGLPGAVLNPDFENFKISTWPELREWIPWDKVVPKYQYRANKEWEPLQPFRLVFDNGADVICKGVKDEDSARGPNINWLWYDEGGRDLTGGPWQVANASVRVGHEPQAWVTTTPRGVDHWIYRLFIDQEIPEEAIELFEKEGGGRPLVEIFSGSIDDNKENLDPGFYASILAMYPSGWLREQEVHGRFVSEGGILGDRSWFDGKVLSTLQMQAKLHEEEREIKARVRYWDLAASEKKITGRKKNDPDETVGTLMSWDGENFYIEDQVCGHWSWKDIKENIFQVAMFDGYYVPIYIEQEPGSGGINQVEEIKLYITGKLPAFKVERHNPRDAGDKVMRANAWFSEAAAGKFYMLFGEWNEGFLRQLGSFPELRHDDRVDSVSGARHTVAPIITWRDIEFKAVKLERKIIPNVNNIAFL